ncbi:MAG: hypothetical protein RIQ79_1007 [Verrucomicrobiota bacterium]|jgi:hypothetical protein
MMTSKSARVAPVSRNPLLPAATALAAFSGAGVASASIVYFTPTPGQETATYNVSRLFIDVDGGGSEVSNDGAGLPGYDISFQWGGGIPQNTLLSSSFNDIINTKPVVTPSSGASKLSAGAVIDAVSDFGALSGDLTRAGGGDWFGGGGGYYGFEMNANGVPFYGWIQLNYFATGILGGPDTLTVIDWAYEDSGAPIAAGSIPEPAESAAIMAGAVLAGSALMMSRRRQRLAALAA